jgi:cytochrome P450
LDRLLLKNPLIMGLFPSNHVVKFSAQQVQERKQQTLHSKGSSTSADDERAERRDFLGAFLKAKQDWPELVTDRQVLSYANSNIFAGSDTTAISLRSILFYLLKTPEALRRVVSEIDSVVGDRDCEKSPVTFSEATNQMPFLQAVLKESLRMHPAVGLLLERVVPPIGIKISGKFLAGGTVVGICPWVLHRDKRVFGEDADCFRPERWIEAAPESLRLMERSNLAVSQRTLS